MHTPAAPSGIGKQAAAPGSSEREVSMKNAIEEYERQLREAMIPAVAQQAPPPAERPARPRMAFRNPFAVAFQREVLNRGFRLKCFDCPGIETTPEAHLHHAAMYRRQSGPWYDLASAVIVSADRVA